MYDSLILVLRNEGTKFAEKTLQEQQQYRLYAAIRAYMKVVQKNLTDAVMASTVTSLTNRLGTYRKSPRFDTKIPENSRKWPPFTGCEKFSSQSPKSYKFSYIL